MKIHGLASNSRYARHVSAVWRHLPDDVRGEFRSGRRLTDRGWDKNDLVIVGGFYDIDLVSRHKMIYVEHGAGQAYNGDRLSANHACYHGGVHPESVIGYISPRQDVADSWGRPAFAAGCPAVEEIVRTPVERAVITFHWDAHSVCSEARSALLHYYQELPTVVDSLRTQGFEVVGHWHPNDRAGERRWRRLGVETSSDVNDLLATAKLVIADNTSFMYEAALLGVPTLALNAPWYRREVSHGLRFWDYVPGDQVDEPEQLAQFNFRQYCEDDMSRDVRERAVKYCYGSNVGGKAAADWVTGIAAAM